MLLAVPFFFEKVGEIGAKGFNKFSKVKTLAIAG
jgi:hypothetical protein